MNLKTRDGRAHTGAAGAMQGHGSLHGPGWQTAGTGLHLLPRRLPRALKQRVHPAGSFASTSRSFK